MNRNGKFTSFAIDLHIQFPKAAKSFNRACLFLKQAHKICEVYLSLSVYSNGKFTCFGIYFHMQFPEATKYFSIACLFLKHAHKIFEVCLSLLLNINGEHMHSRVHKIDYQRL